MYSKIVVPLDGSSYGECVLGHVKTIASGCRTADVVLLYVVEPMHAGIYDIPQDFMDDVQKKEIDSSRKYLDQLAGELNKSGINASTAIIHGDPSEAILEYIRANQIELVVMSTHGKSGVTRWALGSVTDKVVHQASVPVLIVSPVGCRIRE